MDSDGFYRDLYPWRFWIPEFYNMKHKKEPTDNGEDISLQVNSPTKL